jgi:hypothetical protein
MKYTLKTLLTTTILISPSFASAEEALHMHSTGGGNAFIQMLTPFSGTLILAK